MLVLDVEGGFARWDGMLQIPCVSRNEIWRYFSWENLIWEHGMRALLWKG